jgi:hypothetical protein
VRPVRCRKVRRNGIGTSASLADLSDHRAGFALARAVVDENLGAHPGETDRAGAAYPARSAGNESGFSGKTAHDLISS